MNSDSAGTKLVQPCEYFFQEIFERLPGPDGPSAGRAENG
jgi:hypothetical protein